MNDQSMSYSGPSLSAGDKWRAAFLALGIILGACAYSFRLSSFLDAKDAVLGATLLLLALVSLCDKRSPWKGIQAFMPLWILLLFSLLVHLAIGTAHVSAFTIETLVRFSIVLLFAAYAYGYIIDSERGRSRLIAVICASASVIAVLGLLQFAGLAPRFFPAFTEYDQRVYSVFGNQDLFGGYIALSIPLAVAAYFQNGRSRWPLAVFPILFAALLLSGSRSAWIAACAGTLFVLPYRGLGHRAAVKLGAVALVTAAVVVLLAPEATLRRIGTTFSQSDVGYHARLWFWDATARMMRDHPMAGVGLGNYQYWSPSYQGEALHAEGGARHYRNEIHTLHAHSDPLELASETGLVGMALLAWMLWRLRKGRGAEWGGLVAYFVFGTMNTTIHSAPHILAALLLACGLLERGPPPTPEIKSARASISLWAPALAALLLFVMLRVATLVPGALLSSAREAYDVNSPGYEEAYRSAVAYAWPDYEAAEEWAVALLELERQGETGEFLELARQGRDTWSMHFLSAKRSEFDGKPEAALEAYRASIYRWPGYMPAWSAALALLPGEERDAFIDEARVWLRPEQLSELEDGE